jgi:CDP-diacylglycerol--glycerol-3-phosphate 3-phosphatidyltransferase
MKITANQITVVRILALPFPCWALIERPPQPWMWVAFVVGTLIGATDFVDGWLARRDGPTLLGSLLDPVADKLFIACLLLPLVMSGECPSWAAGLLIVRELLITALRTSLAVRKRSLKTSQLGKLKTVVQMGGIATYYLTLFVPRDVMPWVHLACSIGMLALCFIFGWRNHRRGKGWLPPAWLLGGTPLWFGLFVLTLFVNPSEAAFWQFIAMVTLTWVSGADYLWGAGRALLQEGLSVGDLLRCAWSVVHGLALVPVVDVKPGLVVPVIVSVCAELSYGGIDNGVAAERARFAKGSPIPSTLVAIAVGVMARIGVDDDILFRAAWGLACVSLANALVAFVLDRDVFLSTPDRPVPT